jgi:hypothetical protein
MRQRKDDVAGDASLGGCISGAVGGRYGLRGVYRGSYPSGITQVGRPERGRLRGDIRYVVPSVSENRLRPSGVFKSSAAGQFGSPRGGFRSVSFAAQAMWMATLATQAPRVKACGGAPLAIAP